MFMRAVGLAFVAVVLVGATITDDEKQVEDNMVAQTAKDLNDTCESKITVAIDWKSFAGVDLNDHSVAGFCQPPLQTLTSICDNSATKKKKIQSQLKSISCVYAGKAAAKDQAKEPEIKDAGIKAGKLVWRFNWNAANVNDYMIDFFKKAL
jgi:hypothetical protein